MEFRSQLRYTLNGGIKLDQNPIDILTRMLTSCAGGVTNVGGKLRIHVGAPGVSIGVIDENDVRSDIEITTKFPRKEAFNRIAGTFVSPKNFWAATDFPPISNASFEEEDGRQFTKDIELPFTTDETEAQRLGQIALNLSREQAQIRIPGKLSLTKYRPWDVVSVNLAQIGWLGKQFRCSQWSLGADVDGIGVDLSLAQDCDTLYDWNPGDEVNIARPPLTNQSSSPPTVQTPPSVSNLTLVSSGQAEISESGVNNRIKVDWLDLNGEDEVIYTYEVEYKASTDPAFISLGAFVHPPVFINFLQVGVAYDVRVRVRDSSGNLGEFITVSGHTVVGDTVVPPDPTALSLNGTTVSWLYATPPLDFAGFRLKFNPGTNTFWADATLLTPTLISDAEFDINSLPAGPNTILVKAVDTSGNESDGAATLTIDVPDPGDPLTAAETDTIDFHALGFPDVTG